MNRCTIYVYNFKHWEMIRNTLSRPFSFGSEIKITLVLAGWSEEVSEYFLKVQVLKKKSSKYHGFFLFFSNKFKYFNIVLTFFPITAHKLKIIQ